MSQHHIGFTQLGIEERLSCLGCEQVLRDVTSHSQCVGLLVNPVKRVLERVTTGARNNDVSSFAD